MGLGMKMKPGLILRNLETGSEEWLAYPVQRDEQESIAPLGVLPAMSFTPGSENLIVSYGGKLHSVNIGTKKATEIPFEVDVTLDMGPLLQFKYPIEDDKEAFATQIRNAKPSPDGSKLAFTALNRLYVMDYPNGTPRRVTNHDFIEAHPSWSPNGDQLVFATWNSTEGHIYKANVNGRANPVRLTNVPGVYTLPEWSYNSNRIVFHRGSAQVFQDLVGPLSTKKSRRLSLDQRQWGYD